MVRTIVHISSAISKLPQNCINIVIDTTNFKPVIKIEPLFSQAMVSKRKIHTFFTFQKFIFQGEKVWVTIRDFICEKSTTPSFHDMHENQQF